jgi:hypothetical protein
VGRLCYITGWIEISFTIYSQGFFPKPLHETASLILVQLSFNVSKVCIEESRD